MLRPAGRVAAGIGLFTLQTLLRTVRFDVIRAGTPHAVLGGPPVIYALWHDTLLPLAWHHRHKQLVTLISASRDGDYITRATDAWGYHTIRGSSSRRGSAAFRELVRAARAGKSITITVDGPRGPRHVFKDGALTLAQMTGLPIVTATAVTRRAWYFDSWDRFMLPKPFSKVLVAFGDAREIPRTLDEQERAKLAQELAAELERMREQVEEAL